MRLLKSLPEEVSIHQQTVFVNFPPGIWLV